jgi:2,5-diketo-D-gluconate reductase A
VWQIPNGKRCVDAVRWALELGYRHVDTAQSYGNEASVGEGLRQSGVSRHEVFITTKFHPAAGDPVREIERSLRRLRLDHVDLYLIHWPQRGPTWAWPGMERAHELGHARSIGVSNYGAPELDAVVAGASVRPAINQVELNPYAYRRRLVEATERNGVAVEAYSPLGTGVHVGDEAVIALASRVGRTPAQVLIRWGLQHGFVVIPKSTHRERIQENARVWDFELTEADMAELDALDQTAGTDRAAEDPWW